MTDPLPDYYRAAVVPEQLRAGLCALCRTPTDGSEFCPKCSNAPYRPDAAGFTSYAIDDAPSGEDMRRYKGWSPNAARALDGVRLLLEHGLEHRGCAEALAGASLDAVAVIPSRTHHVPGAPSPLQRLCSRTLPQGLPTVGLSPTPGSTSDRRAHSNAFDIGDCRDLSHVLIIDDTWVSGAAMLSAVWGIRGRGVERVSVLALARWLNRQYPFTDAFIRRVDSERAWCRPQDVCPFTPDGECPQ